MARLCPRAVTAAIFPFFLFSIFIFTFFTFIFRLSILFFYVFHHSVRTAQKYRTGWFLPGCCFLYISFRYAKSRGIIPLRNIPRLLFYTHTSFFASTIKILNNSIIKRQNSISPSPANNSVFETRMLATSIPIPQSRCQVRRVDNFLIRRNTFLRLINFFLLFSLLILSSFISSVVTRTTIFFSFFFIFSSFCPFSPGLFIIFRHRHKKRATGRLLESLPITL